MLHELSRKPEVQQRLREEVLSVLGPTAVPTGKQLQELHYAKTIITETLRCADVLVCVSTCVCAYSCACVHVCECECVLVCALFLYHSLLQAPPYSGWYCQSTGLSNYPRWI